MNDSSYKSIDFGALTRAGEGLTQWRALATGFITALTCGVLFWLMQWSVTRMGGIVGIVLMVVLAIACFVVWVAGSSAVGVLLMDKARNLPQRSIGEAAAFGLGSVPKFLLLAVAVFVVTIAFMLVAALIYFICKIPVIGAVLAFVAHPVLLLIASAFIIACIWVVFPLFAPAVWSGLGFKQALASVFAIARHRLVQVVLMMMVLYIILFVIGMLIASGVVPAMGLLTGLATSIMGGGGGYGMGGMGAAMAMFSNASMTGAFLGASVLSILLFALVALVAMMGINLLYLQAADGLDTAGTSSDIEGAFGVMKEKAREAADKARAAADRAKQAAADRAQATSNAREEAVMEQTKLEEEEANQPLPEQEALRREMAEREAREAQARDAQARAEAQRQAAARAAAPAAASQAPAASSAAGAATAGAAALGGLMTSAAAATGAAPEAAPVPPPPPAATTKGCKACGHTIGAQDMFCENCGSKQ
ncbi:zinc ribbon domain-containing protein [Diaphorobacter sp. HDW4A]|uniref:zinc ribbon domain-containing protein n=1 Tax=Diaphorobacter sp. HDW4A TaxID=2714924 RepID=UPI00140D4FDB|nr:zinc ribbon domain-containing protein [Diaphorobacter sp. HDW4A]QIL80616.1 zinc ribbon domain-containing protein [Diaphorobacter sp. HDW4A]